MSVAPVPLSTTGQLVDMSTVDNTYGIVSVGPLRPVSNAQLLSLSDDEDQLVRLLVTAVTNRRYRLELHNAYYEGTFRLADLGISIPPQMRSLKTALGWCRVAVDSLNARLGLQGFRYPDSNDVDQGLQDIVLGNRLESESQMAHLDAFVFGAAYAAVGTNDETPELPIITIESPLDVACQWDARTRKPTAALRLFGFEGSRQATLYLPDQTISLVQGMAGWEVLERDQHHLGVVLVERITNRPRSYDRDGASEITPELMNITDAACRTLLGLEVAREFYSAPQRYILGADESAFQDSAGNPKSGWETYLGRVLALEKDPDGNVPTVGQFTPYDPATYTKVIDMYSRIVSSITSLPPHMLGFTTDNPASADAIRNSENALVLKANYKTTSFGSDWSALMRKALLVRDGQATDNAHRITAVWASTATPTPAATTDAIYKQVTMGYLPATSDVTGEKLGYSPAERARIETDRLTDQGMSALNELARSIGLKDARAGAMLAGYLGGSTAKRATPTDPTGAPGVATAPPEPNAPPSGA